MTQVTAVNHWHSTAPECTNLQTLDVLFSVYNLLSCILVEHQPSPYILIKVAKKEDKPISALVLHGLDCQKWGEL